MPWCDDCSRWHSPNALTDEGRCPTCGRDVGPAGPADHLVAEGAPAPSVPWHFWLTLAALALYLGWRLVQGVAWMADQLG